MSERRGVYLPDVTRFEDLFEYLGEWRPFELEHSPGQNERMRYGATYLVDNQVGPYGLIDLSQLGAARFRGVALKARRIVLDAVAPRCVTPDDHLSFRLIGHAARNGHPERVLVIVQHGYILGNHWIAYIDPESIPPYPYAARDARFSALYAELQEAGRKPMETGTTHTTANQRAGVPNDARILTTRDRSVRAVVFADGSSEERWPNGDVTRTEAAGVTA